MSELRDRIERVRGQIADAAARAGRSSSEVTLVAVSKTKPAEAVAEALSTRAEGRRVPILLEVYLGDDPARPGFRPVDLDAAIGRIRALASLEVRGLMTVAPLGLDREETRLCFRRLRELRDRLAASQAGLVLDQLSMGMTEDFPLAIEEGATMIRVGRAIFGDRG